MNVEIIKLNDTIIQFLRWEETTILEYLFKLTLLLSNTCAKKTNIPCNTQETAKM